MICINVKSASQGGHENHQEGGKDVHVEEEEDDAACKINAYVKTISSITTPCGTRKLFYMHHYPCVWQYISKRLLIIKCNFLFGCVMLLNLTLCLLRILFRIFLMILDYSPMNVASHPSLRGGLISAAAAPMSSSLRFYRTLMVSLVVSFLFMSCFHWTCVSNNIIIMSMVNMLILASDDKLKWY